MTAESAFKRETIMSALIARTGRLRQRYDNGLRLVSGCIPYRLTNVEDGAAGLEHQFQVLMISSPNRGDLVFPKGGWEDDETMGAAAVREALEEAGVRGELDEDNPLGFWVFRSKSRQDSCSLEGYCKGYMFALEVTEELECWPEQANHERRWLSVTEAFELCRYDWMREALKVCRLRVLFQDMKHHVGEDAMVAGMAEPASEVDDHPIPLPSCFMKSSDPPHLENPINAFC